MPHLTSVIDSRGPIITVHIGVSLQRASALKAASSSVPQPVPCNLLIDTGAAMTCLDTPIIEKLGITPTGSIPIHTPSTGDTPHQCSTYDISLIVLGGNAHKIINALPVIENDFNAQSIDGLLGRDILLTSRLIYSGPDNIVMLTIL